MHLLSATHLYLYRSATSDLPISVFKIIGISPVVRETKKKQKIVSGNEY